MQMQFEFGEIHGGQCILCLKWRNSCQKFRLLENSSLPSTYRTLYTFKCMVCPDCKERGHNFLTSSIKTEMDKYIGGCL
jgi:hypothetical protein